MPVAIVNRADGTIPGVLAQRWIRALCAGIVGVYALFFVVSAQRVGPVDQDQFLVFHELQYWNAMLFGLAKQWSPVMCSGFSLAGEPQVPFMSLSMVLGYVLGPFWGIKGATLIYFAVGWVGAYLYAGQWLTVPLQRALAAALFIGNGFFVCRLGAGHADFLPFLILPLVLWMLHQCVVSQAQTNAPFVTLRLVSTVLCLGGILSLAIDGSPVTIIHLLFWIGLYAFILGRSACSWAPPIMLLCAAIVASVLDAGYLWPMIAAQADFPRRMPDTFTSPFSLVWFALLPVRGKLLPANGLGHELSVFIGPVIAWAIWRQRHWLGENLPAVMRSPLRVVSIVAIVMGMGSLAVLHVPHWLSLFDVLRPLPGFRSIGVTGRYWGFLALPLSLVGAAALWRFAAEPRAGRALAWWMGAAMLLQLGFQSETIFRYWIGSAPYRPVLWPGSFKYGPETVSYVAISGRSTQGAFITPTRGVVNCYDMDDFTRAETSAGTRLVRQVLWDRRPHPAVLGASASFESWNRIQLRADAALTPGTGSPPARVRWILNQAYHPNWHLPGCVIARGAHGNLIADCPISRLHDHALTMTFFDPLSAHAALVSLVAWRTWIIALCTSLLSFLLLRKPGLVCGGPARGLARMAALLGLEDKKP